MLLHLSHARPGPRTLITRAGHPRALDVQAPDGPDGDLGKEPEALIEVQHGRPASSAAAMIRSGMGGAAAFPAGKQANPRAIPTSWDLAGHGPSAHYSPDRSSSEPTARIRSERTFVELRSSGPAKALG
jgi:hypothetical protein